MDFNKLDESPESLEFEQLKYALDQSTILAVTDKQGVITYVNDRFCEISKYTKEELIGKTHSIVNSGYHGQKFFISMWRKIGQGKIWKGQIKNKAKDGSYYWVETTIVPLLDETGMPKQYMAIRTDITYQKEAEKQIAEEHAKTIYAEKMASLGEMSAGIAHELGNPLGALRGRVEMLQRLASGPNMTAQRVTDFSEKSLTIIDRMSKIIRSISSFAREASNDPYTTVELKKVIEDLLNISTERLHKYDVTVDIEELDSTLEIEAREAEIGQVLLNLIRNSYDAIQKLDNRWIKISGKKVGDKVVLQVTDSGPGIPENVVEKIFNSFYTTKAVGQGTGLGLSISKKIIESYGGKLEYDKANSNTSFVIHLPILQSTPIN